MKQKLAAVIVLVSLVASSAYAQDATVHKRSNGPRRQLATIVFAGLGGAILGLSTLSFYGRPQDHLANIAVGFAIGVIGGTTYVTFRTATTHEYYDEPPNNNNNNGNGPGTQFTIPPPAPQEIALDSTDESNIIYGPLLAKVSLDHTAVGGQVAFRF